MTQVASKATARLRYLIYEVSPFGASRLVGELEAGSDCAALREARKLIYEWRGELRQGERIVCRFGRT